jgi:hypothetical protein
MARKHRVTRPGKPWIPAGQQMTLGKHAPTAEARP